MLDPIALHPTSPASLIRRYCSEGTGRLGAEREEFITHGTLARMSEHLFSITDEEFEAHFIATDVIDLHRDNLLAMKARGELG